MGLLCFWEPFGHEKEGGRGNSGNLAAMHVLGMDLGCSDGIGLSIAVSLVLNDAAMDLLCFREPFGHEKEGGRGNSGDLAAKHRVDKGLGWVPFCLVHLTEFLELAHFDS